MRDPREGIAPDGTIVTGAARARVPAAFEPLARDVAETFGEGSLYLYGSVATGQARRGISDLDLLAVGAGGFLYTPAAASLKGLVRGVEISAITEDEVVGDGDEAYGNRVFLKHYCVRLAGPDISQGWQAFPADDRAARGFNGDIARHADQWRNALRGNGYSARTIARKTLLALAGLVSVQEGIWTTDRRTAAVRWAERNPAQSAGVMNLLRLSEADEVLQRSELDRLMDGVVTPIVEKFSSVVGLWGKERRPGGATSGGVPPGRL